MMPSRGSLLGLIALLLSCASFVAALQAGLAGVVDWHKPLIGKARSSPTPPSFVDTPSGQLIVTLTERNLLAALHAGNGSLAWRHALEPSDPVISYHVTPSPSSAASGSGTAGAAKAGQVLLLSGPGGSTARLFDLKTGHAIWERSLIPQPELATLTSPVWLGTDVAFAPHDGSASGKGGSVVILSAGRRLNKIWIDDGALAWSFEAPGVGDTIIYKQLLVAGPNLHVLAVTSSFAAPQLATSTFSLETSIPLGDLTQVPSIVQNPEDAHIAAAAPSEHHSAGAQVVWQEQGRIRLVSVDEKGKLGSTVDMLPGKGLPKMLPSGENLWARTVDGVREMRHNGFVVAERTGGAMDVLDVREKGKLVATFPKASAGVDGTVTAVQTKEGIMFGRTYWNDGMGMGVHNFVTIAEGGDKVEQSFTFPYDARDLGQIDQAIAAPTVSVQQSPKLLVVSSTGALRVVAEDLNDQYVKWTREEELSDIAFVRFVDLGEPEVGEARHLLADETFFGRLIRHAVMLRDAPAFVFNFVSRLVTGSYTDTVKVTPLSSDRLYRDQFGFQKLLVAITSQGKLYALDSANGKVIWSHALASLLDEPALHVVGMWRVRDFGEDGNPLFAVLATRGSGEEIETLAWSIDGFTGQVASEQKDGKVIFQGPVKTAFLIPYENCSTKQQVLAVVSERTDELSIFPFCKTMAGKVADEASTIYFTSIERSLTATTLQGHSLGARSGDNIQTDKSWSMSLPTAEQITSVVPAGYSKVASFGRVKGDKDTLYKYLNPHLAVVTTRTTESGSGQIHVVDTASGSIVWSGSVETQDTIKAVMNENWLVYTWLSSAGWRLASIELYEDRNASKAETPGLSSFAAGHDVTAFAQTFISPVGIQQVAFTDSKFGITAKDLIVVDTQGRVGHIPRRLLDPRRPYGKASKADQEEMLYPYDPLLHFNAMQIISHNYPVVGLQHIAVSPSLLESTSLMFAHGLDLFLTRGLNPSGAFDILTNIFNKGQLLLTLGGLSVGIFMASPAVKAKQLRAKWY